MANLAGRLHHKVRIVPPPDLHMTSNIILLYCEIQKLLKCCRTGDCELSQCSHVIACSLVLEVYKIRAASKGACALAPKLQISATSPAVITAYYSIIQSHHPGTFLSKAADHVEDDPAGGMQGRVSHLCFLGWSQKYLEHALYTCPYMYIYIIIIIIIIYIYIISYFHRCCITLG